VYKRQVKKIYTGALFFVLPTLKEGSPLVILEAMSCGLPVISTDVSGIPDILKDGYNGFLIQPKDVDGLYQKMNFLINDPKLRKIMGRNARQTALKFDWENVARKTIKFYELILTRHHLPEK